jgi:hypothetical protein
MRVRTHTRTHVCVHRRAGAHTHTHTHTSAYTDARDVFFASYGGVLGVTVCSPEVLVTMTPDLGKLLTAMASVQLKGRCKLANALNVAQVPSSCPLAVCL